MCLTSVTRLFYSTGYEMTKIEAEEYNPDVMDKGFVQTTHELYSEDMRFDQDARVILGATVGVMVNRYAHEDQSTSL